MIVGGWSLFGVNNVAAVNDIVSEPQSAALIVDDSFLIRMFAAEMPDEAGFRVLEASTAEEALMILNASPEGAGHRDRC